MQEVISLCQRTLFNLGLFPLYFILVSGLFMLVFQIFKTQVLIKKILKNSENKPLKLKYLAEPLGLEDKIDVVSSLKPLSFCYGFLNPRICLSKNLINNLSSDELKAILLHEKCHLKSRDPLKIILSSTFSSMLFFLPVFRDFHQHFLLSKEISADQLSIRNSNKGSLISVLSKFLNYPSPNLNFVAGLTSETLERRITYLRGEKKFRFKASKTNLFLSVISIFLLFLAFNTPVSALNGEGRSCYEAKNFSVEVPYSPVK